MLIISVEIMKTIDEREMQKTTKEKQTKTERSKRNRSYSERVRAKWFYCAFKLGFLQLICKASLIFKSNLELALSIILKQRELYESKYVAVECRYILLNPRFKMTKSFAYIARTIAGASKFIYLEKYRIIANWVFIWKTIFNFEFIKN